MGTVKFWILLATWSTITAMQKYPNSLEVQQKDNSPILNSIGPLESIRLDYASSFFIIENYDPHESEKDNLNEKWVSFQDPKQEKKKSEKKYVPRHIHIQENYLIEYEKKEIDDITK